MAHKAIVQPTSSAWLPPHETESEIWCTAQKYETAQMMANRIIKGI